MSGFSSGCGAADKRLYGFNLGRSLCNSDFAFEPAAIIRLSRNSAILLKQERSSLRKDLNYKTFWSQKGIFNKPVDNFLSEFRIRNVLIPTRFPNAEQLNMRFDQLKSDLFTELEYNLNIVPAMIISTVEKTGNAFAQPRVFPITGRHHHRFKRRNPNDSDGLPGHVMDVFWCRS
ncbi:unnamed protein product [Allacma fusca]|uniref:Uncharacterized protein n=1 Tax=Allacma fusca TaxID=39272 RepID=A0A8J2KZX2_9HEXA|nr:unnamed protein product [Allacma fusca]